MVKGYTSLANLDRLMNIRLVNDDLQKFVTDWETARARMGGQDVPDTVIEVIITREVRKASWMRHDFVIYDRMENDDP